MTNVRSLLCMGLAWLTVVGIASAGTLEERFATLEFGFVDLGDDFEAVEDYLDDVYVYGASLHLPLAQNVSVIGNISRTSIKGRFNEDGMRASLKTDLTAATVGGQVHFLPHNIINPFVGVSYSFTRVDVEIRLDDERAKDDDWERALLLSAGAELNFTDDFSLLLGFTRTDPQGSSSLFEDDLDEGFGDDADDARNSVNAALNFWVNDQILLSGTFNQDLEDDTRIFGVRVGFAF